ncbi:MAG TPA: type II toxin-antitoxin system HicA family toxin [Candidatus Kapabacteria bacterium]|nr:type II toxin-antitoxin system HicA family toxin [Candidatus Kapabacteria bacterium]
MTNYKELLAQVLSGRSDANIRYDELCHLLSRLGFSDRMRGSHHIFAKPGVDGQINLQPHGRMAKKYQVKQVRKVLTDYGPFEI